MRSHQRRQASQPQREERHDATLHFSRAGTLRARISQQAQGLSIFERVIVANSAIIILATVAGWWLTQHNAEVYHFIIDTTFIGLAALSGVVVNFILLRAAFAPLRRVLTTIHAVEQGKLSARVDVRAGDADTATLARAFNGMLDRLAEMRDEAAGLTLRAQEEERRRLALELHDQTGQSLTALTLHAQAIGQTLAHEQSDAAIRAGRRPNVSTRSRSARSSRCRPSRANCARRCWTIWASSRRSRGWRRTPRSGWVFRRV